jgi:hypothetical protein
VSEDADRQFERVVRQSRDLDAVREMRGARCVADVTVRRR